MSALIIIWLSLALVQFILGVGIRLSEASDKEDEEVGAFLILSALMSPLVILFGLFLWSKKSFKGLRSDARAFVSRARKKE